MTPAEMFEVGVRARTVQSLGSHGPLAVVLPNEGMTHAEGLLGMISAADRPMRLFRDLAGAEKWIKRQRARLEPTDDAPGAVTSAAR